MDIQTVNESLDGITKKQNEIYDYLIQIKETLEYDVQNQLRVLESDLIKTREFIEIFKKYDNDPVKKMVITGLGMVIGNAIDDEKKRLEINLVRAANDGIKIPKI